MASRDKCPGHSERSECPVFCAKELTPREQEILQLRAGGMTGGEIALQLTITERTVKAHLANARRKLSARDTIHAVVLAIAFGFIDLDAFLRPRAA